MNLLNGVERLNQVQPAGAKWMKQHLVDTLYSEIDEALGS